MFTACPKCRHDLTHTSHTTCPACGLVFAKFLAAERGEPARRVVEPDDADLDAEKSRLANLRARLLYVPDKLAASRVYAHIAIFIVLAIWGWRIAAMDIRDGEVMSSFIHAPILVFHEAGHVIFSVFGHFVTIAGGTIAQLLMPIALGVALLRTNRDSFGASIALWWLATSFMDAAPYAYDAADPKLVLLGGSTGAESDGHDWINMLGDLGMLKHAHGAGRALHLIGIALMLVANAWSVALLWRQYRNRTDQATLE